MNETPQNPALDIRGLNVFYGASHALQGVDLALPSGVMSVVGRNGMGKTTLCKAIIGLIPIASGSTALYGKPISKADPGSISRSGVGYVPQGRRLWKSLTVDEHLKMLEKPGQPWSVERIYEVFPRLAERKNNGGAQLSGGEQQMLAIARALLQNPRLLIMDEPTEGLAPVIVDQVADLLVTLAAQREMDVLVIEQNIRIACAVSEQVAIMLNGRINRLIDSTRLAADKGLQQALLGVGRHSEEMADANLPQTTVRKSRQKPTMIYSVNPKNLRRWSAELSEARIRRKARAVTTTSTLTLPQASALIRQSPVGASAGIVLVAGTLDTKAAELRYVRDILRRNGLTARLADLSLRSSVTGADIPSHEIATIDTNTSRPLGDRVGQMADAFEAYVSKRPDIRGIIALGGSSGSAVAAPGLRALPLGIPKILVTTMASGDISPYIRGSDLIVIPSVADISGLNHITGQILANAANSLSGMVKARQKSGQIQVELPSVALSMFGITTTCVTNLSKQLAESYECITFHATGWGGQSMEALVAEGQVSVVCDITTTEIADEIAGGVLSAGAERLDVFSRINVPYLGAAGALDTVNFGARDTLPNWAKERTLLTHNSHVTLMRTNVEECQKIGAFISKKLNKMLGPFVFLLPEGGVSHLDRVGGPFENKEANEALFKAIETGVEQSSHRLILRVPHHINSPEFTRVALRAFRQIEGKLEERELRYDRK
ncbi:ATP-binding cassette domain-containing protein [Rhodobacteraceae bacterium Araon29]